MNRRRRTKLVLEKLEARQLMTLSPNLVLDIKTDKPFLSGYQLGEMEAVGDSVYFTQAHPNYGSELWRVGPTGDPQLVKDIQPGQQGSQISQTTSVGNKLLFIAQDDMTLSIEVASSLWVSDGTEAGTFPLSRGIIGTVSFAPNEFQNQRYFMRYEKAGGELWKTDGTLAGTKLVKYVDHQYGGRDAQWAEFNNRLYFTLGNELWRTDGTEAGTVNDFDGVTGTAPKVDVRTQLGATSIGLFYRNFDGVWYSDGASDTPIKLTAYESTGSSSGFEGLQNLFEISGKTYFGFGGVRGPARLWRTDGTVAGTEMAIDLSALPAREMRLAFQLGNSIVFAGSNKIWSYDGNTVTELGNPGDDAEYFRTDGNVGYIGFFNNKLWRTDGTVNGTSKVADISVKTPVDETGYEWALRNGNLYFYGFINDQGYEIFKYGGGQADPVNISHLFDRQKAAANFNNFAVVNNKALFFGQPKFGDADKLYVYDSVANTIATIQRSWPAQSFPSSLVTYRNNVYFLKQDGIWKSDGTEAGTTLFSAARMNISAVGDVLFLQGPNQYYISDGTTLGTRPVNLSLSGSDLPFSLFTETPVYSAGSYWILYKNPTGAGNRILKTTDWLKFDEVKLEGAPSDLEIYGITPSPLGLFIHTAKPNEGIWFAASTTAKFLINPNVPLSALGSTIFYNNKLFFKGFTNENGGEPWYTDGTVAGTKMLLDINKGPVSSGQGLEATPSGSFIFTVLGSKLLMQATTESGIELWASNGTASGTRIVDDIVPGRRGGNISFLKADGNYAYFAASDRVFGEELWITDGTATGTYGLTDLMPGTGGSNIQSITVVGDDVLFLGSDATLGKAVWSLNRAQTLVRPSTQELLAYENSAVDVVLGKVEPSPQNTTPQFSIKSGNGSGYFAIDPISGQIKVAAVGLDFEAQPEHLLTVGQGASFSDIQVRIKVLDINEPVSLPGAVVFTVRNDAPVGTIVGRIPMDNPEWYDRVRSEFPAFTQTYGFGVDAFSGEVYVGNNTLFATLKGVSFDVQVTDFGLPFATYLTKVVINFTDFNEPPVLVSPMSNIALTEEKTLVFPFEVVKIVDPESEPMQFKMQIDNQALPAWIVYDSTSRTFTATPPVGTAAALAIQIEATDSVGQKITTTIPLNTKPFYRWHNYAMPMDSSRNGSISPLDALLVINYLNSGKPRDVKNGAPDQVAYIDTSGDNLVSPLDALLVINFLNARAEAEGESIEAEPFAWNEQFVGVPDIPDQNKKRSQSLGL